MQSKIMQYSGVYCSAVLSKIVDIVPSPSMTELISRSDIGWEYYLMEVDIAIGSYLVRLTKNS